MTGITNPQVLPQRMAYPLERVEVGISFVCPPVGFVLSTVDVCGGLDWFYKKF